MCPVKKHKKWPLKERFQLIIHLVFLNALGWLCEELGGNATELIRPGLQPIHETAQKGGLFISGKSDNRIVGKLR